MSIYGWYEKSLRRSHNYWPVLSDNSGIPPAISSIPVLQRLMKFKIGSTRVSIQATDVSGNVGKCTFSITVKGM